MSFTILIPVHFYVFFNHHAPSDRGVLGWELSPAVGATVVKTTSLSASIFVSGPKISTLGTTYVGTVSLCQMIRPIMESKKESKRVKEIQDGREVIVLESTVDNNQTT